MKRILLSFTLCFTVIFAFGAPIDSKQAQKNAEDFLVKQKGSKAHMDLNLCYTGHNNSKSSEDVNFYIFSSKENKAFVIAAADDRITPILGYSTEGEFQYENMPENLKSWLSYYENNIPTLLEKGQIVVASKSKSTVSPLLRDMAWNQDEPFNNLTPLTNSGEATATGCVATAMSQIMRYHRWPERATGTVSYTTRTLGISITQNLGAKAFDWDNMPGIYSSTSTTAENAAVAQLMYYAGVSVEMNYNLSSGAYSSDVPKALIEHFGYSTSTEIYYRDMFSYTDWTEMIKSELDAARPVYYAGTSPDGGHAFVCDGYDANGLFHINWGWGGTSNGYFSLLEMNPSEQGIGGGGGGGFITNQSIITGIKPAQSGDVAAKPYFGFDNVSTTVSRVSKTSNVSVSFTNLFNYGSNAFSGSLGLALYSENDVFNSVLVQENDLMIQSLHGWYTHSLTTAFSNVAAGKYHIRLVSKLDGSSDWTICKYFNGITGYLTVEVTESEVIFSSFSNPVLTLDGSLTLPDAIYAGKRASFSMTLKNNGETEYSSYIGLSVTKDSKTKVISYAKVLIPAGASQALKFSVDSVSGTTGTGTLNVLYDVNNGSSLTDTLSGSITSEQLTILASTSVQATIPTVESFTIDKTTFAIGDTFTLNATLKSSDATDHFEAPIVIFIFSSAGGGSVGYLNYDETFSLAPNATVNLTIPSSLYITPGDYILAFFYYNSTSKGWTQLSNKLVSFTLTQHEHPLVDPTTELSAISLYPNPASDAVTIGGLGLGNNTIQMVNIQGQVVLSGNIENGKSISVSHLPQGIYIAIIKDMKGNVTKRMKFIKQ
ncbi:hypothetical protein CYCD_30610 [Tenuifilaceae bacterium CYCD]|nr:hypothetical protein CYCD_30610 [Tenuifilaceae bacterium CYCD]